MKITRVKYFYDDYNVNMDFGSKTWYIKFDNGTDLEINYDGKNGYWIIYPQVDEDDYKRWTNCKWFWLNYICNNTTHIYKKLLLTGSIEREDVYSFFKDYIINNFTEHQKEVLLLKYGCIN